MPYSFPSYMSQGAATSNSSLEKSSLLTPPLTPLEEHETPYKPTDSDRTSLRMRSKSHHRDKGTHEMRSADSDSGMVPRQLNQMLLNRHAVKHSGFDRVRRFSVADSDRVHNKTLHTPVLNHHTELAQEAGATRLRRWTLPSKSAATRSITPLRSTVKQATSRECSESPAMITLRRATSSRSPPRTELTFFPEPKFGSQKTGLFAYLVSTLTGSDYIGRSGDSALLSSFSTYPGPKSNRIHSTHPAMTFPAPNVYTETTVDSDLVMPGLSTKDASLRRCSTKYMSGGSTYEIIWDENDTAGSSHHSSGHFARIEDRRPSQAVIKLEARLLRDQTRPCSDSSSICSNTTSVASDKMFLDRVSTAEKLRQVLPRLAHKSSLRDLPRSRGFRQFNQPFSHLTRTDDVSRQHVVDGSPCNSAGRIEFFPPLQSRKASVVGAGFSDFERRGTTASNTPPSPRQIRLGSLVGSSSHARRRSSAFPERLRNGNSEVLKGKARVGSAGILEFRNGDSDTQPLLGKNSSRQNSSLLAF